MWVFLQLLLVYSLNQKTWKIFILATTTVFFNRQIVTISQAQTHLRTPSFCCNQPIKSFVWDDMVGSFHRWTASKISRVLQHWNNVWMLLFSKRCQVGPSMEMWTRILKIWKIWAKGKWKSRCLGCLGICLNDISKFFWDLTKKDPSFKRCGRIPM